MFFLPPHCNVLISEHVTKFECNYDWIIWTFGVNYMNAEGWCFKVSFSSLNRNQRHKNACGLTKVHRFHPFKNSFVKDDFKKKNQIQYLNKSRLTICIFFISGESRAWKCLYAPLLWCMRLCTVYSNIVYDNLALSQNVISRTDEFRATKDCIPHLELRFRQPFISISLPFSRCDISLLIAIIFYCIISLSSCHMSHVYASPRMGINENECAEKRRAD